MLYPWLVSFGPSDTLSHRISVYGSEGSYTYINRDCAGNITSELPIPFSEIAASYEAPIEDAWGWKVRGGYLTTRYGYNIVPNNTVNPGATQKYFYGGASVTFSKPFWGIDIGALAFNHPISLANDPSALSYAFSARLGYIDAWYFTTGFLNTDPIVGSRPAFNSGIGFALNQGGDQGPHKTEAGHVWLGMGFGPPYENGQSGFFTFPYDGVLCGELAVPAFTVWQIALRGGIDLEGHGGGYVSGGLSYGW